MPINNVAEVTRYQPQKKKENNKQYFLPLCPVHVYVFPNVFFLSDFAAVTSRGGQPFHFYTTLLKRRNYSASSKFRLHIFQCHAKPRKRTTGHTSNYSATLTSYSKCSCASHCESNGNFHVFVKRTDMR